ncbi:adhesion protein, partial [Salmonella enterica subsp. enterica serovar Typhimurium]|nr:adhesion protein [Salmonella enterica subsp. enterica serovar Typhimurium]
TCTTTWSSIGSLVYSTAVSLSNMKQVATALKDRGLGMDIVIQEGNGTPALFSWKDIQAGFSGWSSSKAFGQRMEAQKTYNRSGTLTFRIFVYQAFKNNFLNITIPSSTINILPYDPNGVSPPSVSFRPLTVSAFNLRFIPDNSGTVIISPSNTIKMGHFYTEYKETMVPREVPFTVTAQQNVGTH